MGLPILLQISYTHIAAYVRTQGPQILNCYRIYIYHYTNPILIKLLYILRLCLGNYYKLSLMTYRISYNYIDLRLSKFLHTYRKNIPIPIKLI